MTFTAQYFGRVRSVIWGVGVALAAALCLPGTAPAAGPYSGPDPVDQLRQALSRRLLNPDDPEDRNLRKQRIEDATKQFRLSDLRRALVLVEWQDDARDENLAEIDRQARRKLIDQLRDGLAKLLKGDTASKLAALTQTSEIGIEVRGVQGLPLVNEVGLTEQIRALLNDPNPTVRETAARTLGTYYPNNEPISKDVIADLGKALRKGDVGLRRAASEGLANLVRTMVQKQKDLSDFYEPPDADATVRAARVKLRSLKPAYNKPEDAAAVAKVVIEEIGPALQDVDAEVRGFGLEAFQFGGGILRYLESSADPIPEILKDLSPSRKLSEDEAKLIEKYRASVEATQAKALGLGKVLADKVPTVAAAISDPEPPLRLLAAQGLREVANSRLRLMRAALTVPGKSTPVPGGATSAPRKTPADTTAAPVRSGSVFKTVSRERLADDTDRANAEEMRRLLGEGLGIVRVLPVLSRGLKDPNQDVRLETLYVIELLNKDGAPAAPAVTQSLDDSSPFVRWAAARTLGKMGADNLDLKVVVPALARRLDDRDLDVRRYAAATLESFGPTAVAAIPALNQQVGAGDAEMRISAIHALRAIGGMQPTAETVQKVSGELSNSDNRVRLASAEALRQFGPAARSAVPALRRLRSEDADIEVRKTAADALLSVLSSN